MLQTFTRNDQLQEQYRLHEEWLRVQRTEEYARQKLQDDYVLAMRMKEQAEKEKEQAEKEKEQAEKEKFQAFLLIQEKEQEIIRLKQMLESKE